MPLNVFLLQEIERMEVIVTLVRETLQNIVQAIDGQIIMTTKLMESINCIYDAKVPHNWMFDNTEVEISWIYPRLG